MTGEQQILRRTAREAARAHLPLRRPFTRAAWRELARAGFADGAGMGAVELGIVLEELGRQLAPAPLLATVVLAGGALARAGRDDLLAGVADGERILAFAHDEGPRHRRLPEARVAGGRLDAVKTLVLHGDVADDFVVSAGDGLYLVRGGAPGVSVLSLRLVDGRPAARVTFAGAPAERVAGLDVLDAVLDRGCAALAAEMLGGMQEVFDRTVEYLKTRRQFGAPIGSFQALKHRAALLHVEIELARSVIEAAARALDAGAADAPALCSAAKARAADAFVLVANEAVQLHGGIGVTAELDIGLFLKRARVAEQTLGTAAFHRERWTRLQ